MYEKVIIKILQNVVFCDKINKMAFVSKIIVKNITIIFINNFYKKSTRSAIKGDDIMNKITIIGAGHVGATIAYTLTIRGVASEIVIIDINEEKAYGEAMDINQGVAFCDPCNVYAGSYEDAIGSDIVVIASGIARRPDQTRLELAQTNVDILKSITPKITKIAPDAVYLLVSNPVDVLTYVFTKISGIPKRKIIGSGTLLDTARLRSRISEIYSINQRNVHAYVLGEHGDSSFIPWSIANISNVPIAECDQFYLEGYRKGTELNYEKIEDYVHQSGGMVISSKGATFYAVSASISNICECLLGGIDTTKTVSTMLDGEYGLSDVCLSTLCVLGHNGIRNMVNLPLNEEEIAKLHKSANQLKDTISKIKY